MKVAKKKRAARPGAALDITPSIGHSGANQLQLSDRYLHGIFEGFAYTSLIVAQIAAALICFVGGVHV